MNGVLFEVRNWISKHGNANNRIGVNEFFSLFVKSSKCKTDRRQLNSPSSKCTISGACRFKFFWAIWPALTKQIWAKARPNTFGPSSKNKADRQQSNFLSTTRKNSFTPILF